MSSKRRGSLTRWDPHNRSGTLEAGHVLPSRPIAAGEQGAYPRRARASHWCARQFLRIPVNSPLKKCFRTKRSRFRVQRPRPNAVVLVSTRSLAGGAGRRKLGPPHFQRREGRPRMAAAVPKLRRDCFDLPTEFLVPELAPLMDRETQSRAECGSAQHIQGTVALAVGPSRTRTAPDESNRRGPTTRHPQDLRRAGTRSLLPRTESSRGERRPRDLPRHQDSRPLE